MCMCAYNLTGIEWKNLGWVQSLACNVTSNLIQISMIVLYLAFKSDYCCTALPTLLVQLADLELNLNWLVIVVALVTEEESF